MTDVAMALGLSAGAITGPSLRGVIAAARAGVTMVAVPLVLLVATIGFSCEYVGRGGWLWFGDGILAGLALGELAFLLGQERRNKAKPPGPA
jgi:hypothetical protein